MDVATRLRSRFPDLGEGDRMGLERICVVAMLR